MLAACGPGRLERLKHPAPYPGGQAPPWVNNPVPSRPPGQLPGPSLKDLADLAVRKAYEGLLYGKLAVSVPDAVAVARLAWQIERDEAIPARDAALAELAEVQQALLTLKDAIIRRSGQDEWRALWGGVREERDRARQHREARQRFVTAARAGR
jgi:hypothetical protein